MNIEIITNNGKQIARVTGTEVLVTDTQSALDLMASVKYETECTSMILDKEAFCEDFFKLSTCLAGEILQKYINYGVKIAVIGDYSCYTSKPLHDFIYECNHGKDICFVGSLEEAVSFLGR